MSDPNNESPLPVAPSPPVYRTVPVPLETAPCAIASLVCGIIGVVVNCTGLVMGILALVMRKKAMEYIRAQPGRYGGEGFCTAGLVLGIISIVIGSISTVCVIVWLLVVSTVIATIPLMH